MNQATRIKNRAAAIIQITVLLLVQVYFFLPAFGDFISSVNHGSICCGNHQLCGCPLDRIANRTCCCFKSSKMPRDIMDDPEMKSMAVPNIIRSPRFVCPTCDNQPNLIPGFLENIKFLRFRATPEIPCFLLAFFLPLSGNIFQTWSNEPPDPPPKLTTF